MALPGSSSSKSPAERRAAPTGIYASGLACRPNAPRNHPRSWKATSASPPSGPTRGKAGGRRGGTENKNSGAELRTRRAKIGARLRTLPRLHPPKLRAPLPRRHHLPRHCHSCSRYHQPCRQFPRLAQPLPSPTRGPKLPNR